MKTTLIIIFLVLAITRLVPVIVGVVEGAFKTIRIILDSLRLIALAAAAGVISLPMVLLPGDIPKKDQPWAPLNLDGDPGLFQRWKVRALGLDRDICFAALDSSGARASRMSDHEHSGACHIRARVRLAGLSNATMAPVETRCAIAARIYLWERQVVQPAARELLGNPVKRINHFSSFSCRAMRTSRGTSSRMSQHATANAFDIAGFVLADGRQITLLKHWKGNGAEAKFLRRVRDGLCDWFNVTLSPDYNALHADHFHVDMGPFLSCR